MAEVEREEGRAAVMEEAREAAEMVVAMVAAVATAAAEMAAERVEVDSAAAETA